MSTRRRPANRVAGKFATYISLQVQAVFYSIFLYEYYNQINVVVQRNEFLRAFSPRPGERVLDVGSGPGFLVTAIFEAVGTSGSVCGVDISEPLLDAARSQFRHHSGIEFRHGDATQLPYPAGEFDAVVSTQVLEYVPDVDAALAEFNRVVRTGGRVALLDTDWDSIVWHSPDRVRMNRILEAWEKHAADPHLPRTLANRLHRAGFRLTTQEIIPLFNANYDPNTYSNRMIDLIVPFVTGPGGIDSDEAEAWARDLRKHGERGEYFFGLNRYFFLAEKS
jgi:ubiquinone/menaquinone biosynthesis C-methylase UbiE